MNFLQLCQRAVSECGVSGTLTTTTGQTGSLGRIVSWIGDAWNDVQSEHDDWDWMRSSNLLGSGVSFVPAAGQASSTLGAGAGTVGVAVDDFGKWDRETFRCYTTTVGTSDETFLDNILFDTWRDAYMLGAMRTVQTRPVAIAVGPDQSLNLGPPPNGLYTITGDYFVAPSAMESDTDVPVGLPSRFHNMIVYATMMKYAGYESAPEVYQTGDRQYRQNINQLEARRLPRMSFAGALA